MRFVANLFFASLILSAAGIASDNYATDTFHRFPCLSARFVGYVECSLRSFWFSCLHSDLGLSDPEQIGRPLCRRHVIQDLLVFGQSFESMDTVLIQSLVQTTIAGVVKLCVLERQNRMREGLGYGTPASVRGAKRVAAMDKMDIMLFAELWTKWTEWTKWPPAPLAFVHSVHHVHFVHSAHSYDPADG
ncbi:MAG: hypothetical protein ACREC6_14340, partial [Hyphomicrobiaceae bacterium]